jgi:hypothetical protein
MEDEGRRRSALERASLWLPEEGDQEHDSQRRHLLVARERASDSRISCPTSRLVEESPRERPRCIGPSGNQMARWAAPSQFGPWLLCPGKTRGTPQDSIQPNEPLGNNFSACLKQINIDFFRG